MTHASCFEVFSISSHRSIAPESCHFKGEAIRWDLTGNSFLRVAGQPGSCSFIVRLSISGDFELGTIRRLDRAVNITSLLFPNHSLTFGLLILRFANAAGSKISRDFRRRQGLEPERRGILTFRRPLSIRRSTNHRGIFRPRRHAAASGQM